MSYHPFQIPNARAAQIPDSAVEQLVVIGASIEAGQPTDSTSIELLRLTCRALFSELLKRRHAMAQMGLTGPEDYLRIVTSDAA